MEAVQENSSIKRTFQQPIYAKIVQAEAKKSLLILVRRSLSYAKRIRAERNQACLKLLRRSLFYAKIGIYSELYNCFVEIIMGTDKGGAAGWTAYNRPVESAQSKRANCEISITSTLAMVSTNRVVRSYITSAASSSDDNSWAFFAFYLPFLGVDLKEAYWFEAWTRCNSTSTRLVRSTNCWIESCSGRMVINSPA